MRDLKGNIREKILTTALLLVSLISIAEDQDRIAEKEIEFEVKNVFGLNSDYAEFSPVLHNQQLIFASDREYDITSYGEGNWKHTKHVNIFAAKVKSYVNDSVVFEKVEIYDNTFISDDHVGPICFSADGKEAIFSQVSHTKQRMFGKAKFFPQLYSAKLVNGKWKEIKKLSFVQDGYSYSHPAYSADGNQLYFASDAPEAKGGKDIFVSTRTADGWTVPKSVEGINSTFDEVFPTVLGKTLYFSSTGFDGQGGLDLFRSKLEDDGWSIPESLGPTINSKKDDFGLVFNPNKESGYFSSNREGNDDIYYFNRIEKVTLYDDVVAGKFSYRYIKGEDPSGLEVLMLDEDGEIIFRTTTNSKGEFIFKELPADGKYTIKLLKDGEEVTLTLYGKDSDTFLISDESGSFVYRRLKGENVGTLALIDSEDVDLVTKQGTLNGQLTYRKLKGEDPDGFDVYLVDEDGNIIMKTKTDKYGNFQFRELPMDKNYMIKIDDTDEDIELVLYNKHDDITATLAKDENGNFVYRKLSSDYESSMDLLKDEEGLLVFSERKMAISGEFIYSELAGAPADMEFEILDGDGNFLMRGKTDGKGYFNYTTLPLREEIMFKLDEESVYFKRKIDLKILSRSYDVLVALSKDEKGFFTYRRLGGDRSVMKEIELGDDGELVIKEINVMSEEDKLKETLDKVSTIYYNRNDKDLTAHDEEILDDVVLKLKENTKLTVQLDAYASARGDAGHNMRLSQRRVDGAEKYLRRKGISSSRISKKAHGASAEDNKCGDDEECLEAMHRLNRKTEIKLVLK